MSKIVIDVVKNKTGKYQAILPEVKFHQAAPRKESVTKAPLPREEVAGYKWAPWGIRDTLPTDIRRKIEKVPMAGTAIYKLIAMMNGNGLAYYRNSDLADGNTQISRAYIPEVEAWLKRNRIRNKFLIAQFADYRYYMNCFSEFILNRRKDFITGLYHKPAEFCRLSKQNERSLNIEFLAYSPDFACQLTPSETDGRLKWIPLFNWQEEERFLDRLRKCKFAYHTKFETPGITYYARPFWLGLFRKNGWIDASCAVPEIVNAMMQNQITLKYQVLIPETYFSIRHQDWETYTDDKRNSLIDKLIKDMNATLSGTSNAFKSITTVFKQDPITGADLGKVEIIAIDDKVKKDNWVPSSEKSDAQVVQGLGLHPSQVGLATEGGKMGAGSGSDQRESFNTGINLNTIDQQIVLEPLNYAAQFNARKSSNWDITFFIDHTHHTTINNQESGLVPSETTIEIE